MSAKFIYTGGSDGFLESPVYYGDTISLEIVGVSLSGSPTIKLFYGSDLMSVGLDAVFSGTSVSCTLSLDTPEMFNLFEEADSGSYRNLVIHLMDDTKYVICDKFPVYRRCSGGTGTGEAPVLYSYENQVLQNVSQGTSTPIYDGDKVVSISYEDANGGSNHVKTLTYDVLYGTEVTTSVVSEFDYMGEHWIYTKTINYIEYNSSPLWDGTTINIERS